MVSIGVLPFAECRGPTKLREYVIESDMLDGKRSVYLTNPSLVKNN